MGQIPGNKSYLKWEKYDAGADFLQLSDRTGGVLGWIDGSGVLQGNLLQSVVQTQAFSGAPTGSCVPQGTAVNSLTGDFYSCQNGVWTLIGPTAGSLVSPITSPNPLAFDVNLAFKGPTPYTDVTRYGVRAVNQSVAPAVPGITATINSSSTSATISAASTFKNGDGVVIFGAGAAHSMTTPTGLTVTPSVAAFGTGTGIVVNGPAGGATTYNYQIVARDKQGGLTAASSVATTASGAASLGAQSVAISGFTRSGSTVTATTSAPHGLSSGAMVYIFTPSGTDNLNFGGWYIVATVADNTHFTYVTGQDVAAGAPSVSIGGGTANWFNCNHLSWSPVTGAFEYYIYGRTGGSLTLLGVSKVQSTVNGQSLDTTWDDFGSPMMDGILLPYIAPSTPPVSATSDSLVTTISSGAGTTTLTLANAAGTSVSGVTILFDNAPNITAAAANCINGSILYFPGGSFYVTNSYLTIPGSVSIHLAGAQLFLNDTMELGGGDKIFGMLGAQAESSLSFGFAVGAFIEVNRANPGIYSAGSGLFLDGVQFTLTGGSSIGLTLDNPSFSSFHYINFSDTGNGFMSIPLLVRTMDFLLGFHHVSFICGPTQVNGSSATPAAFFKSVGNIELKFISLNRRGIYAIPNASGGNITFSAPTRIQGGITPFFSNYFTGGNVGVSYTFNDVELDTMPHALFANLPSLTGGSSGTVVIRGAAGQGPSSGFGIITGKPGLILDGSNTGQNTSVLQVINTLTFANLGTPANGNFAFCPDCVIANPCTGGGTGAFAKRLNGVWVCN